MVISDRLVFGEVIIIGLRIVKEVVRFYDLVNGRFENIVIIKELKRFVRLVYIVY